MGVGERDPLARGTLTGMGTVVDEGTMGEGPVARESDSRIGRAENVDVGGASATYGTDAAVSRALESA